MSSNTEDALLYLSDAFFLIFFFCINPLPLKYSFVYQPPLRGYYHFCIQHNIILGFCCAMLQRSVMHQISPHFYHSACRKSGRKADSLPLERNRWMVGLEERHNESHVLSHNTKCGDEKDESNFTKILSWLAMNEGSEEGRDGEKPSELSERWSEWDVGEENSEPDQMSYRPRERGSFHTWRQPADLGWKDTETSSAAEGDRPKEV